MKGWQRSFDPSMKFSMAVIRSSTEVKLPRRMAWRVMIEKEISAMFSHDPEVGVKCSVNRVAGKLAGFATSPPRRGSACSCCVAARPRP